MPVDELSEEIVVDTVEYVPSTGGKILPGVRVSVGSSAVVLSKEELERLMGALERCAASFSE